MNATDFIIESNKIEGIHSPPTQLEIDAHNNFMKLENITVQDLKDFVFAYQPNARLRDMIGMNVMVGNYHPPEGGPDIKSSLELLLFNVNIGMLNPYNAHIKYESLHPFTDCNGRSGRILWLWMMRSAPLGFLHTWYYQSLANSRT